MEDIICEDYLVGQSQRENEDLSKSCYIFYNIHLLVQIKPISLFRNLRYAQAVCNSIADCGGVGWLSRARRYELRAGTTIRRSRYRGSVSYVKHCRATKTLSNIVGRFIQAKGRRWVKKQRRPTRRPTRRLKCSYNRYGGYYLPNRYPKSTGRRRYT